MNIANPYKILVVAGALVFGFGLRADGTLPIPGANSSLEFPLLMGGSATELLEANTLKRDISMSLGTSELTLASDAVVKACAKIKLSPVAHPASGTVQVGDDLYEIEGLCAPKTGTSADRSVIASSTGRLLQLDGSFKLSQVTNKLKFAGKALTIDTVNTTPESGEPTTTTTITFEMDQLPLD